MRITKRTVSICCIALLSVIAIIILFLTRPRKRSSIMTSPQLSEFHRKIYGEPFSSCKSIGVSESYGIMADSAIVCKTTKSLPATPIFYYENFPTDFMANGWCFVNLDTTDFLKFKGNSPQFMICKTKQAYNILSAEFPEKTVIYTGFTSLDKYDKTIRKEYSKFLHVAGKSPFKGTNRLLSIWSKHPKWPDLIVIARDGVVKDRKFPNNIKVVNKFLSEKEIIQLSNSIGIHICSSEHEGFGHYLHEAKGMASVVVYTDAPPMNETFVDGEDGIGIESIYIGQRPGKHNLCPVYNITEQGLENAVEKVLSLSENELIKIGEKAREGFLLEKEAFENRFRQAILGDNKIPNLIHRIWISKEDHYRDVEPPEKYKKYLQTWSEHNPDFQTIIWSGEKLLNLIEKHFPEFLDFYKSLELICKCDFARFAMVFLHGGLYVDMDFICRKSITDLLRGDSYFVFEPEEHRNVPIIYNGFFALPPNNKIAYDWLSAMSKNLSKNVLDKTGPDGFSKYLKQCSEKVLFGNTCDVMPLNDKNLYLPQCNSRYNNYTVTVWQDGSGWGSGYEKRNKDNFGYKTFQNPITGSDIRLKKLDEKDQEYYRKVFANYLKDNTVLSNPFESIYIAHALKNRPEQNKVYFAGNKDDCKLVEELALINSLSNLEISYGENSINFLDGSPLVWEDSDYVKANFPSIDYNINEKRQLFQIAKNLPPNHGVIDVGAHIGDLAVPLAKALANAGRNDVMVYAIDPSPDKCDFMKKIARYNGITNITVVNIGLSDCSKQKSILEPRDEGGNNWIAKWVSKEIGNTLQPIGLYYAPDYYVPYFTPSVAILLTTYVVDNRKEMYTKNVKRWLQETDFDIYLVSSSGKKIDITHPRFYQHVFKQEDGHNSTIQEVRSLLRLYNAYSSQFNKYNYLFKITGKYVISDLKKYIGQILLNTDFIVQSQQGKKFQNTELLGIRTEIVKDFLENVKNMAEGEKECFESILFSKFIQGDNKYSYKRLKPIPIPPAERVPRGDGSILSEL